MSEITYTKRPGSNRTAVAEQIRGNHGVYTLTTPLDKAAGCCQWGFAKMNGRDYFIKKFIQHKIPDKNIVGEANYRKLSAATYAWAKQQEMLYTAICRCGFGKDLNPPRGQGNLVTPSDFFRDGSFYYLATEKVEGCNLTFQQISQMDMRIKLVLMRVLARELTALAAGNIIHSDIKPDNLILKKTNKDYYTFKIIDFDQSFIQGSDDDTLGGDQTYCPPEYFDVWSNARSKKTLTPKSDVFALGLIFHQILCGRLPAFSALHNEKAIGDALRNGGSVMLAREIPEAYKTILGQMICNEKNRVSMAVVFNALQKLELRR